MKGIKISIREGSPMSILSQMSKAFKLAASNKASNVDEINELIQYSKIDVPLEFLDIL